MTLALNASSQDIRNIVVKFGQGAFFAHHAATITVATATTLKLTVDTEIVDVCSWFDDSLFTPKQPGYYLLFASLNVTSDTDWSDGKLLSMFIRKNAATPAYVAKSGVVVAGHPTSASGGITQIVILEANGTTDNFDLAVSHDDDSTIGVSDIAFGGVFVSYNKP